jgi:hypothetical protein
MSLSLRKLPIKRAFTGLAGSVFAKVRVVPPQAPQPPTPKPILVHFCFNQEAGETKPTRCNCHFHITKDQAYEFVDAGQAHFLLVRNPKTPKPTKHHRAIVARQTLMDGKSLFALAAPLKPDRREAKHDSIKAGIFRDARRVLQKLLAAGAISPEEAGMSDGDLENVFEHPEAFLERISSGKRLRKAWAAVVEHWWNNLLGLHRLNMEAGQYMKGADRSTGLLVSGGYDSTKISDVDAARETDDGSVPAANHRPSFWNGAWDYSSGARPDVDQSDQDRADWTAIAHSREDTE